MTAMLARPRPTPRLRPHNTPVVTVAPVAAVSGVAPRPLLDRWFLAWAERAEARWRAHADLRSRYY